MDSPGPPLLHEVKLSGPVAGGPLVCRLRQEGKLTLRHEVKLSKSAAGKCQARRLRQEGKLVLRHEVKLSKSAAGRCQALRLRQEGKLVLRHEVKLSSQCHSAAIQPQDPSPPSCYKVSTPKVAKTVMFCRSAAFDTLSPKMDFFLGKNLPKTVPTLVSSKRAPDFLSRLAWPIWCWSTAIGYISQNPSLITMMFVLLLLCSCRFLECFPQRAQNIVELKYEEVKVSASKSLCRSLKFTGKNCIGTVDSIGWKSPRDCNQRLDAQTVITVWKHCCNQMWKQPLEARCGIKRRKGKWKQLASPGDPLGVPRDPGCRCHVQQPCKPVTPQGLPEQDPPSTKCLASSAQPHRPQVIATWTSSDVHHKPWKRGLLLTLMKDECHHNPTGVTLDDVTRSQAPSMM